MLGVEEEEGGCEVLRGRERREAVGGGIDSIGDSAVRCKVNHNKVLRGKTGGFYT